MRCGVGQRQKGGILPSRLGLAELTIRRGVRFEAFGCDFVRGTVQERGAAPSEKVRKYAEISSGKVQK